MASKYLCAALAAGAVLQGQLAEAREAPVYSKVNRDSEYAAPDVPATAYNAPAPSYAAPAPSYAPPSYVAYEDDTKFPDVTFIIVGILIVTGLALLFPTYVSVSSRKKRDVDEGNCDAVTSHEPAHQNLTTSQLTCLAETVL